jgi:hypothetical protein
VKSVSGHIGSGAAEVLGRASNAIRNDKVYA